MAPPDPDCHLTGFAAAFSVHPLAFEVDRIRCGQRFPVGSDDLGTRSSDGSQRVQESGCLLRSAEKPVVVSHQQERVEWVGGELGKFEDRAVERLLNPQATTDCETPRRNIEGDNVMTPILNLDGKSTTAGPDVEHPADNPLRYRLLDAEPIPDLREIEMSAVGVDITVVVFDDVNPCSFSFIEVSQ